MMILVEPLERRCQWLDMVVEDLGLGSRVDVVKARAEQVVDTIDADIVTARAVKALKTLVPLTLPLVHGHGELLALKGRSAQEEVEKASKIIRKYKGRDAAVLTLGTDVLEEPTTVVRVRV